MKTTPEQFREQHTPRFGRRNPERATVPFWDEQIRSGENAWAARRYVMGQEANLPDKPTWSFDRFGSTATRLPDGRVLRIAGEHEDHYDPDFWIYNDVTVFDPDGSWQHYLYPREIFPPTDFHATVWVEPHLYVLGSLGYREDANRAFVYRLDTRTWQIERFDAANAPPVNLHMCFASVDCAGREVRVVGGKWYPPDRHKVQHNDREWLLDLQQAMWRQGDVVGPPPVGPLDELWTREMKAVHRYDKAYELIDVVRRTVGLDHPLFGVDLWPLYADVGQAVFRVDDGSDRHVLVDLGWGESRAQLGPIAHRFIEGGNEGLTLYVSDPASWDEFGHLRFDASK